MEKGGRAGRGFVPGVGRGREGSEERADGSSLSSEVDPPTHTSPLSPHRGTPFPFGLGERACGQAGNFVLERGAADACFPMQPSCLL